MLGIFRNISHHLAIVRDALRAEKDGPKQRSRSRNELEFLPAVLEVTETPPATIGRGIIWTIMAFVVASITWAFLGELDIVAVAPGKVVATAGNMPIQPVEIGVVRSVYVRDGQVVSAGDPILELDPTETAADAERLAAELLQSRLDIARLEALLAPDPTEAFEPPPEATIVQIGRQMALLRSQWQRHQESLKNYVGEVAVLEAETASLRSEAESLTSQVVIKRDVVGRYKTLVDREQFARTKFQEMRLELITLEGEAQVKRRMAELNEVKIGNVVQKGRLEEAEFRNQINSELKEAEKQAFAIEQELVKARKRETRQILTAPADGTVQELNAKSIGQVVNPAEVVAVVVPSGNSLEVRARVENKDKGFVTPGQEVEIKVDAFQFTKWGMLKGKVLTMSEDAIADPETGQTYYQAVVSMDRTIMRAATGEGKVGPGMSVTAEIKTGKRGIYEYVLAPLVRGIDESFRER
tara:strand:- start:1057 stop:2463 length:1407 start_codon:yes stop_codon:yes gene_type:complete